MRSTRVRSRAGAAAVTALCMLAGIAWTGAPAGASSSASAGASAPDLARVRAQQPLVDAASVIQWSVERGDSDGYAGIVLEQNGVVLWWKGTMAAHLAAAVRQARGLAPVRVATAAHTRAELRAAAAGAREYLRSRPGSPYHSVDIAFDGSGLVLATDLAGPTAAPPAEMKFPQHIPVSVVHRDRPTLPTRGAVTFGTAGYLDKPGNGRMHDAPPFYGGGRIINWDNRARCSTGFSVQRGGIRYLMTAGHCGRPNGHWYNGNLGVYVGMATWEHQNYDLLLIPTNAGPAIWDGGVDVNEFVKAVAGWDWVFSGEWLCTSGSVTGAQCGSQVTGGFADTSCAHDVYGNYECYSDLITANRFDGNVTMRAGDDGGPVFGLADNNRVIAKGIMTAPAYGSGNGFMFQDFATAWRLGITPLTG